MFIALFNKPNDIMNSGPVGFLECRFWEARFFFWTLSVASTYNIVTMTVERSTTLLPLRVTKIVVYNSSV